MADNMDAPNVFMQNDVVLLRAPEESDAAIFAAAANHPDIRSSLYIALPTSVEEQRQRIVRDRNRHDQITFTICTTDGLPVGLTSFVRIDWVGRMATYFIAITPDHLGQGLGQNTTRLMRDYAFDTLNLNRIQLHVSTRNKAAVHIYQKAGFRIEGTLRQAMYYNGIYLDFYLMAVLRSEGDSFS